MLVVIQSHVMMHFIVIFLIVTTIQNVTIVQAQNDKFVQTVVPCDGTNSTSNGKNITIVLGYTTIEAMNNDMINELEQIQNGRPSQEPYIFVLCPNHRFDVSVVPLRPILSGSVFTCGLMGNVNSNCTLFGGTNQIIIDNDNENPLVSINFIGITHEGFINSIVYSNNTIATTTTTTTTLGISNSRIRNFVSNSIIQQENYNTNGIIPIKIQISGCTISNGTTTISTSSFFTNIGNEFSFEDISVDSASTMSFVVTGSSNTTEGSTFLRRITITNSNITDVFVTMQAADIDAMDITITDMMNIGTVFDTMGAGSTANIGNLYVRNNHIDVTYPNNVWIGINVRNNAQSTINNSTMVDNTNIRHIFSASNRATMMIQNTMIVGVSGGRVVNERDISAGVFANMQSIISISDSIIDDTDSFTAIYFASDGSNITIMNSCIGEGDNQGTAYLSEESNIIGDFNYINPAFVSSVCQESGLRLIQEQVGSGCFDANRTDCDFNCTSFFDSDTCQARFETLAPTITPDSMSLTPSLTGYPTFLPTIATITPSSQQPAQINDTNIPTPELETSTPSQTAKPAMVLPPSFTVTYTPVTDALPTDTPAVTMAPSINFPSPNRVPSRTSRPTLRPIISIPSLFETVLPTGTGLPSSIAHTTYEPSCDCVGKGMKSKKGKDKKMMKDGKGKGMGKGKGGHATYYSDDANLYENIINDDEYNDDNYQLQASYEDQDDHCSCLDTKGKGKGDNSKSKGKSKKGKGGSTGSSKEGRHHESRANDLLHYIESNYDP